MKILLNRLKKEETCDCNYFTPKYYFETEWFLDMHGYIDREELDVRFEEINKIVAENPLLSERAKKGLLYVFIALSFIFILLTIFAAQVFGGYVAPIVIQTINSIVFFVVRYLIDEEAKRRSERFYEAIKKLFDKYNKKDNPTANWKLKWRKVITHFNLDQSSNDITPKYAEEAEIELEINDVLAEITECTIRLHLYSKDKLERITKKKEELEKLLSSNEDYSITIDDKKLPEIPLLNNTPPFNNTPQPDNTPPFNNTPQPDNTPTFNNTPQPDNTPTFNNTPQPDNTPLYNNIPQPDNMPPFNNTSPSNNTEIER
ncbi:hypothetical protein RhiirA4_462792 [Rhizophagus irregularis]|uniref:Uncharacterized protein n=1 Tax=Rhizophagus irregularis TaxID=588596 RepID=A0A2I1GLP5_9GLOM|nr:hypothetical protein RhiirA4_462792 [Rhizophagus irregularis]